MTLEMYYNKSDNIRANKDLVFVDSYEGTLKDITDIVTPSISIQIDSETLESINYIIIPEFNRAYFVTGKTNINNDIFEISCDADDVANWYSYYKDLEAIIERQENKYNSYLNDSEYRAYQNPHKQYKKLSGTMPQPKVILMVNGGDLSL